MQFKDYSVCKHARKNAVPVAQFCRIRFCRNRKRNFMEPAGYNEGGARETQKDCRRSSNGDHL